MTAVNSNTLFSTPVKLVDASDLRPRFIAEPTDSGAATAQNLTWLDPATGFPAATLNDVILIQADCTIDGDAYTAGQQLRALRDTAGGIKADWLVWFEGPKVEDGTTIWGGRDVWQIVLNQTTKSGATIRDFLKADAGHWVLFHCQQGDLDSAKIIADFADPAYSLVFLHNVGLTAPLTNGATYAVHAQFGAALLFEEVAGAGAAEHRTVQLTGTVGPGAAGTVTVPLIDNGRTLVDVAVKLSNGSTFSPPLNDSGANRWWYDFNPVTGVVDFSRFGAFTGGAYRIVAHYRT